MRPVWLLVLLAGCPITEADDPECSQDPDCGGGSVCARDEQCYAADDVRAVTVTWTVNGAAAAEVSCMRTPRLYVQFLRTGGTGSDLDFAPVPCELGRFFVDKLPIDFGGVEIGPEGSERAVTVNLTSSGTAAVDLRF